MSADREYDLLEVLDAIDPGRLEYQEWVSVGMALKDAGYGVGAWDTWSQRDSARYRAGDCEKKWQSFRGSANPVTSGTIVAIARDQGWRPAESEGYELSWEDVIGPRDEQVIIRDVAWVESEEIHEPTGKAWNPVCELTTYLETLFEAGENVGYVTTSYERDGRHLPTKGNWDRTAGELIEALSKHKNDIGAVIGDYPAEAGAWIRFNPLDGQGCKNENVTEFRYALVESDSMEVDKQLAIIQQLELPAAVVVHSGGKSVHAIVRVDAADYDEYRKRVDYLYDVCKKNGLAVDAQNKNPSRLSRMPGIERAGRKQFIVATNIGKESWAEWQAWIEETTDVLPVDVTDFAAEWEEELAPPSEIIEGMLGTNEKMMLAGPSKAGKSFSLIELAAAIAEGDSWMGMRCKQGHVLYINLELKRESRIRRLKELYRVKGYGTANLSKIHSLDLRGLSAPLTQLAPKVIRQAARYRCVAIIIDPIYKIMTGDENSADHVSQFCNQLDSLSRELDCSIIYCHHFSKGQQGQKASIDRASGSGVFARDADALVAMTELDVTEDIRKAYVNERMCGYIRGWLDKHGPADWREHIAQDAWVVQDAFRTALVAYLPNESMNALIAHLDALQPSLNAATAWRVESTLREFAPRKPIDIWYRWPVHEADDGILASAEIKDTVREFNRKGTKRAAERRRTERAKKTADLEQAIANANAGEPPTTAQVMEYMSLDPHADKDKFDRIFKSHGGYKRVRDEATNTWVITSREPF
jgi:RecA-family ATPase